LGDSQQGRLITRGHLGAKKVVVVDSGIRGVINGDQLKFFWSKLEHRAVYLYSLLTRLPCPSCI
jgi:hypothetical protein